MADFVFTSRKQYWAAIRNFHSNINQDTKSGKALRKQFARITGDKKYTEKRWQRSFKQGSVIKLSTFRSDFGAIKKEATDKLKISWREEKEKGNKITWKKYRNINSQPDYEILKEAYNSPG